MGNQSEKPCANRYAPQEPPPEHDLIADIQQMPDGSLLHHGYMGRRCISASNLQLDDLLIAIFSTPDREHELGNVPGLAIRKDRSPVHLLDRASIVVRRADGYLMSIMRLVSTKLPTSRR